MNLNNKNKTVLNINNFFFNSRLYFHIFIMLLYRKRKIKTFYFFKKRLYLHVLNIVYSFKDKNYLCLNHNFYNKRIVSFLSFSERVIL